MTQPDLIASISIKDLRARPCCACGLHFFPANDGDQICESDECAKTVQKWSKKYAGKAGAA